MDVHRKLSIVIPTKDRYYYLKQLIQYIQTLQLKDVEVVVQDNSENNNEILRFLEDQPFPFVQYHHQIDPVSVSKNIDLAIGNARGEYICLIGDDDGILPNIVDCVDWMKANDIEAVRPAVVIYNWPDYENLGKPELSGALLHNDFSTQAQILHPIDELRKLAVRGFKHIYTIPKAYQGIVKRSCLEAVKSIGGTYCPGPSPDMANAVALSFVVKKFAVLQTPVVIVGQSQFVGGGERTLKGAVKRIEEVPFLPQNAKDTWDSRIPKVWCTQTVWPESAIKAIQYMNREQEIFIDFEYILAWFIQTHPHESALAWPLSQSKQKLIAFRLYYILVAPLRSGITRLKSLFSKNQTWEGLNNLVSGIKTIEEAGKYISRSHPNAMHFPLK